MKTTIDRTQYRATHGRLPRGVGLWLFDLRRRGAYTRVSYSGKFADALAFAMSQARDIGDIDMIIVCD